ncbi:MAG: hypothetical protein ACREIC_08290, partial [Limisphaerales bacterium]
MNRQARALATILILGPLLLFSGCERKEPAPETNAPQPTPSPTKAVAAVQTSSDLIRIPAGRFAMGDKAEVDAKPHEVE